ncbi:hypothetical protein [Aurantimonas sp. HBX-1]|uniref:hypothetical protein n=1 Tax=Aurantimonas sp. HBX-1 TaxID=2906072 RepID=UPI001F3521EA|nr:hypothetical protein [Aurantimonas sp. HBX-1]UIJ71478.1 hypothetical protein LXB15_17490 [Aurantimonas sp. HBX-1]
MRNVTPILLGLLVGLAGCNTGTPYPNLSPIAGAQVSANPNPRGSEAYCRQYARQTAANQYENLVDRGEDEFGARALKRQSALADGDRAYQRCLTRGTG